MFDHSERVFNLNCRKRRDGLFTFHKFEGFVNVESIWVHGKVMTARGNASDGKGNIIFGFEQIAFAFKQAGKGAGNITESDKGEVAGHIFSYVMSLRGAVVGTKQSPSKFGIASLRSQ